MSRFILDLRRNPDEHTISAKTQSTIQFAERVEDVLGGSLNSIWGSGIDQDEGENETDGGEEGEISLFHGEFGVLVNLGGAHGE